MSAIFGLVHLDDRPVVKTDLERVSTALAHHGADSGLWMNGRVGLGQRLMCFTPEDRFERKPLIAADVQCALVSDGRIDNRAELLAVIGDEATPTACTRPINWSRNGCPAQTVPDGELILRAYRKWGLECTDHLAGVFAFALWDAREQRLMIARSAIQAPSLVYFSAPGLFAFATMPGGLHALPFVPKSVDEQKLADALVLSFATPTRTLYRDICRLQTGHSLTAGRDGVRDRCFWRPDLKREIRFTRDEDYMAAFDELLQSVVRDYTRSATPIGVMMSGGLDSSSVAATAARLLEPRAERLAAFTEVPRAGFDGPVPRGRYADETPFVAAIAAMYGNLDRLADVIWRAARSICHECAGSSSAGPKAVGATLRCCASTARYWSAG